MANDSISPTGIVGAVEEYLDSLPATKRRKRTRAEIDAAMDNSPESENYVIDVPERGNPALAQFRLLLFQLGQARSDVAAEFITMKIYRLLDLPMDGK